MINLSSVILSKKLLATSKLSLLLHDKDKNRTNSNATTVAPLPTENYYDCKRMVREGVEGNLGNLVHPLFKKKIC